MNEVIVGYEVRNISEKGRVVIPAKFGPKAKEDKLIVLLCNDYVELKEYNVFAREFKILIDNLLNSVEANTRDFLENERNRITSCIFGEVEVDNQGRINLTKTIMDQYHFKNEVVIQGVGNGFRIWVPDKFYEYQQKYKQTNIGNRTQK